MNSKQPEDVRCSFCGTPRHRAQSMVASGSGKGAETICGQCVLDATVLACDPTDDRKVVDISEARRLRGGDCA